MTSVCERAKRSPSPWSCPNYTISLVIGTVQSQTSCGTTRHIMAVIIFAAGPKSSLPEGLTRLLHTFWSSRIIQQRSHEESVVWWVQMYPSSFWDRRRSSQCSIMYALSLISRLSPHWARISLKLRVRWRPPYLHLYCPSSHIYFLAYPRSVGKHQDATFSSWPSRAVYLPLSPNPSRLCGRGACDVWDACRPVHEAWGSSAPRCFHVGGFTISAPTYPTGLELVSLKIGDQLL